MLQNIEIPILVVPVPPVKTVVYNNLVQSFKNYRNLKVKVHSASISDSTSISKNILAIIGISSQVDLDAFKNVIGQCNSLVNILCAGDSAVILKDGKSIKQENIIQETVAEILRELGVMLSDEKRIYSFLTDSDKSLRVERPQGSFQKDSDVASGLSNFFTSDKKSQKRKDSRFLKLQADIYGLMGRYDVAISRYVFCVMQVILLV
jgi:hypothetical protein